MAHYRLYQLDPKNHIVGPPDVIECASDQEAVTLAEQDLNGLAVEVWDGARKVIRLEPKGK